MKIMGHRGARGEYPENTMGGFQHALECGVESIEFDVHLTSDGHAVVIHDDTLDRTTNGSGKIIDHTLSQIKELDAGKGEKVPTLEEVLNFMQLNKMNNQIEIKASNLESIVIKMINQLSLKDLSVVISFNHKILKKVKELDSGISVFPLIYGLPISPLSIIKSVDADGISVSAQTVDKEFVDQCHKENKLVTIWNVNSKEEMMKFIDYNIDFIGTDNPQNLKAYTNIEA